MRTWKWLGLLSLLSALVGWTGCGGRSSPTDAGQDGDSDDVELTIFAIQDESRPDHPQENDSVLIKGVVVTTPMVKTISSSTALDGFWVSEPEGGAFSGIFVFAPNLQTTVQPGDRLDIRGLYKEYHGNSQILATQVVSAGTGNLPAATVVTTDQVCTTCTNPENPDTCTDCDDAEKYEGVLIRIGNTEVANADLGHGDFGVQPTGGGAMLYVSDRFSAAYEYNPTVGDAFQRITGVLEYAWSIFRIQPRSCDDLIDDQGERVCEPRVCPDNPVSIEQIQNPDASDHAAEHCIVRVEGAVVTSPVFDTGGSDGFYIQDPNGGQWSGVLVHASDLDTTSVSPGALITVEGVHAEYHGNTRIDATRLEVSGTANAPEPAVVTPSEVNDDGALAEAYEGVLLKLQNVVTTLVVFEGNDGKDHGDFLVAALEEVDAGLVVGRQMPHGFACLPGEADCAEDSRSLGQRFDFIAGPLGYAYGHFRIQPRTRADLSLAELDPEDPDGDGIKTTDNDNCPNAFNPKQEDGDSDKVGDACDNCPEMDNERQTNSDTDGRGDACDNCPNADNADQADADEDGIGDVCDPDSDGDGFCNSGQTDGVCVSGDQPCTGSATNSCHDNCPDVPNPDQADGNSNGVGDACEPGGSHLLLTEICTRLSRAEFVEIHNPGDEAADLSQTYLTDATSSSFHYWEIADQPAVGSTDFIVKFPDSASIGPGEYKTISIAPAADFASTHGTDPDFAMRGDGSNDTQNMEPVYAGSIGSGTYLGLSDSGEVVALFHWDGASDLVQDVDYVVWARDQANFEEGSDKTGVSVGSSTYLPDTPLEKQRYLGEHAEGRSWQRGDLAEDAERKSGGNGITGHDETSEDLPNTWLEAAPTPGAATQ